MSQWPVHLSIIFLECLLSLLLTIFFPRHWQFSNVTIVETMVYGERGMNHAAIRAVTECDLIPRQHLTESSILYTDGQTA